MTLIHLNEPKHTVRASIKKTKEILKIKPYIILFEYPQDSEPGTFYNKFLPSKKPLKRFKRLKQNLRKHARKYPWLIGDVKIFEMIERLWRENKQVLLFNMDGPSKLTALCDKIVRSRNRLLFDVWNYLREQYMIKTIRKVKNEFPRSKIVIICHDYHWKNIEFLLRNPSKKEVNKYYFSRIDEYIKFDLKKYKILQNYWNKLKT
ncbi:MAG: hypothetical protein KKB25_03305 [Nanoarchaeota archaeon]|nr:hypothetical protein [Nanoarchaeota archaeon]